MRQIGIKSVQYQQGMRTCQTITFVNIVYIVDVINVILMFDVIKIKAFYKPTTHSHVFYLLKIKLPVTRYNLQKYELLDHG